MKPFYLLFLLIPIIFIACHDNTSSNGEDSTTAITPEQTTADADTVQIHPVAFVTVSSGESDGSDFMPPYKSETLYNPEAPIPSQCYTKTEGHFNPCYTCHQSYPYADRPNVMNDRFLQGSYEFSDIGENNHWSNLFENRAEAVAAISDSAIVDYIHQDNFTALAQNLEAYNWQGFIPRLDKLALGAEAFQSNGIAKDGSGWVAFNYKPLPSTFWPTNGSTDDVMIRLPAKFRQNQSGQYSEILYLLNLSVMEMAIKNLQTISIFPVDETRLGLDLNNNGTLEVIDELPRPLNYLGMANDTEVSHMLYPEGTEFLHTVRYIGIGLSGDEIYNAPRMKEVRYMKKHTFYTAPELNTKYGNEYQEKVDGLVPNFISRGEHGLNNGFGWFVLGFIENAAGELRVQNFEETLYCMGCHTTIGSTIDNTFAFARKLTGAAGWGYINLHGMRDEPNLGEHNGEIATYLERVGGGSEFRNNSEMQARFFHEDGSINTTAISAAKDVYELIAPSRERALALNKAYKVIVEQQGFIHGRDATITPPDNVLRQIDAHTVPIEDEANRHAWDIRLDWN